MGQLRALQHLTTADGRSLLSQVAALSTVSGGSWLGVPWTFLTEGTSDADFLNGYVDDPARLVLVATDGHEAAEQLDHLPDGNPGRHVGERFSIPDMVFELGLLRLLNKTPFDMMWQVITARRLLRPYGLLAEDERALPTSTFSLNDETKHRIVGENRQLADAAIHLVADGEDRVRRAELICNSALFVDVDGDRFEYLAPVQISPTEAGVLGTPDGRSGGDRHVGGGMVTSFGLGSALDAVDGEQVTISQTRQFSLADANGVSSAAFAESLQNWLLEPEHDDAFLREQLRPRQRSFTDAFHPRSQGGVGRFVNRLVDRIRVRSIVRLLRRGLLPDGLIPRYRYWGVRDAAPQPNVAESRFADGGSLENTGIAAMLTREHITSIIACVNSPDPLKTHGGDLVVASEIPVLFGFQPHRRGEGYVPYGDGEVDAPIFRHNRVFEPAGFADVLDGLSAFVEQNDQTGPAIVTTTHRVTANHWFGIGLDHADGEATDRTVTVVWVYLNPVGRWNHELSEEVRVAVDSLHLRERFPNYATWRTELEPVEVNLLANQTAWAIANDGNRATFTELFER